MAFVLNDRVKETTTTTGTGTINLAGAATGFETFVAGIGNSNVTYYCIAGQGTAEFEVGIGTVTDASPDTLSRTTILSSSNSDSAVNFSAGTKDVFCTLPASKTIRELDTALNVPTGTTAQRASSPAAGDLRFNTTSSKFEGYSGSAWGNIGEGNFLVTNIFAGDGSDTTFTISNAVADENNLLVFIDGVFQAHDSYSVSGTTVTFSTAPANGRVITIYSALNNVQGADMVIATMTGDNSDTTLALGVTPVSENNVQVYIDGTYQNKDTYSISGQTLTFSTAPPTGTAVEAITHTVTDISAAASSVLVDEFTGDGSDTTFTLSAAPANENNTQVFVGGVYQEKATYSISNAVLTFTAAPANGVSIEVVSIAVGQINSAVQLSDADGDTKVMVEESSDEDKIRFDTGGTERAIIDSTGLGVGTSSPSSELHISSAAPVITGTATNGNSGLRINVVGGGNEVLRVQDGGTTKLELDSTGRLLIGADSGDAFNADAMLRLQRTGDRVFMQFKTDADQNSGILFGDVDDDVECAIEYEPANQALTLSTGNNAEAMRITSAGRLGLGTTNPESQVEIVSTSSDVGTLTLRNTAGASAYTGIAFSTNVTAGREKAAIYFQETHGTAHYTGDLVFALNSGSGGATRVSTSDERMRINSSGILFTTPTYNDTTGNSANVVVASNGRLSRSTSSRKYKNTITDATKGLAEVKTLRPVTYKSNNDGDTVFYGLIAEEVHDAGLTEFVEYNGDNEPDALRYSNMVSICIKAIQEQQDIIDDLKARIETLEGS